MIEYNIDAESAIRLMVTENPFQCPVCKEDFQAQGDLAPHGLLCGHSFCHRDLLALVEEEKVSCPVCVVATDLNLYVGGFPARNVGLVESLDRSQMQWGIGIVDTVPMCVECDADANQRQATVFCTACAVDLCDGCDAQLHARSLRLHQRTPISSRLPPAAKCSVHGDAMRRYCIDCQTSVCANCVLTEGSHHGHNHRLESAVVSERKKKIKDQTAHCFENLCDLQALLAGLRGVDSGLERNQGICLAALRAEKDVVIAAIDARWDVIEQAVMAEVQTRRCNVKVQREAAEGAMWRVDACKREALAAVAAADVKFLAGISSFSNRLEECNVAVDQLLEGAANVPSMAVEYLTAANGRAQHVDALLQAIAAFELAMKPLEPPQPTRRRAREEARLREEAEARQRTEEENRLRAEAEVAQQQAALSQLFGTGELGNLVVHGVVTVPSGQVLQYENVTVRPGGTLRVAAWDGTSGSGGELRVCVQGRLEVEAGGSIDLSGLGYRGGDAETRSNGQSRQGESSMGVGAASTAANGGGGGGGRSFGFIGSVGGGGGGYGAAGANSEPNRHAGGNNPGGVGGLVHGSAELADDEMLKGSGGGGGLRYTVGTGGAGGAGGGSLLIRSKAFCNRGELKCNGAAGVAGSGNYSSGGGGGSGGSIKVTASVFEHVGVISAEGGPAGPAGPTPQVGTCSSGGCGGVGRIRLEVVTSADNPRGRGAAEGAGGAARGGGAAPAELDLSRVTPQPSVA